MALNLLSLKDELQKLLGGAGNSINQGVKQTFAPQIRGAQAIQQVAPRVAQAIASQPLYGANYNSPVFQRLPQQAQARLNVVRAPTIGEYAQGQVVNPIRSGLNNLKSPSLMNKVTGGAEILGGAFGATPTGALYNIGMGAVSGAADVARNKKPLMATIRSAQTNPTSFASTGLGIQNPALALGVDVFAGNPKGAIKSLSSLKNAGMALKNAKGKPNILMHSEDIGLLDRSIDALRDKKSAPNLTKAAKDVIDKLAEGYLTKDEISNLKGDTNRLAKYLQKRAAGPSSGPIEIPGVGFVNKSKPQGVQDFNRTMKAADKNIEQPLNNVYNAVAQPKTLESVASTKASLAKAEFNKFMAEADRSMGTVRPTVNSAVRGVEKAIKGTASPLSKTDDLKDISGFTGQTRDIYRNFKTVFGNRIDEAKRLVLDPFDQAKGKMVDEQRALGNELDNVIQKQLGIKRGSDLSAAVQEFGEKQRDYASLVKQFGKDKADNVVQADQWFRTKYEALRNEVNQVRAQLYPNQPDKLIPYRQDYYRHFREMAEGFSGLKNIFETSSAIPSSLAGVSASTKPRSKFLTIAQRRLGMNTDVDAVGGFLDYIGASTYAKNIDPQVSRFRDLANELAGATAEGPQAGKLNNFINFLNMYADDLAGKTNPWDRIVQDTLPGGRTTMKALTWVNNRVKANVILGNLSSSVAQFGNVPQGVASAGVTNIPKGIARTAAGIFSKNDPIAKSSFIKERYFRDLDKFDTGILNDTKKAAVWITGVLDEVGTKLIWNMHYNKALGQGIANPTKYADDVTRSLVAGRGIGEVPLIQKSKLFQLAAPFQLEVGNLWWVMKDMVDEKQFGQLAKLFVASYLFNKVAEQVRGSDVVFDPIQAIVEGTQAFNEEEDKKRGLMRVGGRVAGEVIGNMPLGQTVGSLYPEYGNKEAGLPTRKDLFGKGDPTRFGTGMLAQQAYTDPLFKILPPFGGNQIKKTIEGVGAYRQGFSGTPDKIRYPIEQNPTNLLKTAAFGQYATPEARDYFDNNGKPLGENQSKLALQDGVSKVYANVNSKREQDRAVDKAKEDIRSSQAGEKVVNDRIIYWDEDTQEVKTTSVKERERKALAQDKELQDAEFALAADRLKGAKDYQGWIKVAEQRLDYLKEYKTKLDDEPAKLRTQKTIEDLTDEIAKYKGYGGFTKGKKPPKITIKATPKSTFRFSAPKIQTVRIKKLKIASQPKSTNKRYRIKA